MAEQRDVQALAAKIRQLAARFTGTGDIRWGARCEIVAKINAALDQLVLEHTRQEEALRAIMEGHLGGDPWQADYRRIKEFACAALSSPPVAPEETGQ